MRSLRFKFIDANTDTSDVIYEYDVDDKSKLTLLMEVNPSTLEYAIKLEPYGVFARSFVGLYSKEIEDYHYSQVVGISSIMPQPNLADDFSNHVRDVLSKSIFCSLVDVEFSMGKKND